MAGQGSGGNVIAALCNLIIPGLGQLVQGRLLMALLFFIFWGIAGGLTLLLIGYILLPIVYLWAILDAAKFKGD